MEQVRCTNCGSTAIIPEQSGEFCKCEACGSTFSVARGVAFSKVVLDHTQDIRAWREYLAKQLKLQQDSSKARDYGGVKLFAQKILSVLPDDFCALFYAALADRYSDNDVAFIDFLRNVELSGVTSDEKKEVTTVLVATVEPKYLDVTKDFIARAYPDTCRGFDAILDRNIKSYIQKLRYVKATDRDVFICHRTAAPDQDIADAICTRLEERGLRCWIAPRNILAGSQNYEHDILNGVENSRLFLLVSSFKSIYSEDCETELKAAVLGNKALYSYRIDDTPYDGVFEKALSDVQWLDAQDDPYAHLEQLVIDIKGLLALDEREKAELEEKRAMAREKERLLAEERRNKEQERLDRLERIVSGETAAVAPATAYTLRSKLKRAEIEVQTQNYERAVKICDEILDIDPECAQAWWLLILCDYRMPSDAELVASGIDFTSHRYFKNVERFTDDEPLFLKRLQDALDLFKARVVRTVTVKLDEAERLMSVDNFNAMRSVLAECDDAFADEKSMVYTRFPDIASRYYWLKLWAKYGQTALVCVEDITREAEYQNAMKYASPAQAIEYRKARDTVSKNAELFLRERSKNTINDGKLSDYLVDNKNILPIDVYNRYSSLLYFRKMLRSVNMTEAQLCASEIDISTNEYFMLAYSVATDEQKRDYDRIVACTEKNRSSHRERDSAERSKTQRIDNVKKSVKNAVGIGVRAASAVTATVMYILFVIALVRLADIDVAYDFGEIMMACGIMRLINDSINLAVKSKKIAILTAFNIVTSVLTVTILFAVGFGEVTEAVEMADVIAPVALSVVTLVLELCGFIRFKKVNEKE